MKLQLMIQEIFVRDFATKKKKTKSCNSVFDVLALKNISFDFKSRKKKVDSSFIKS